MEMRGAALGRLTGTRKNRPSALGGSFFQAVSVAGAGFEPATFGL